MRYLGRKWDSIDNHYHFSDGHLATVKGYEAYGKMAKTYAKMKDDAARQKATEFYVKIQIVGTPDDCIQQIAELRALTGTDHVIADFSYRRHAARGGGTEHAAVRRPCGAGAASRRAVRRATGHERRDCA